MLFAKLFYPQTAMIQRKEKQYRYFAELALLNGLISQAQFDAIAPTTMSAALDVVELSFTEESIFEEVRKRTHYLARISELNPETQNLFKNIALTADEKDLFDPHLNKVVLEILESLAPFTRNILTAFLDRITVFAADVEHRFVKYEYATSEGDIYQLTGADSITNPDGIDLEIWTKQENMIDFTAKLIFYVEVYSWMNSNSTLTLNSIMFEAIVNGIIANWLSYVYPKEAEKYMLIYAEKARQLIITLNQTGPYKRKFTYPL